MGIKCPDCQVSADGTCHICGLRNKIRELESETQEQSRLLGMGSEREAALMAERDALKQMIETWSVRAEAHRQNAKALRERLGRAEEALGWVMESVYAMNTYPYGLGIKHSLTGDDWIKTLEAKMACSSGGGEKDLATRLYDESKEWLDGQEAKSTESCLDKTHIGPCPQCEKAPEAGEGSCMETGKCPVCEPFQERKTP